MSSEKTEVIKFQIRDELMDWFEKLINKKYGPDIHLRYPLDDPHFNLYTQVEIIGSEIQLDDAVEFITNTSEELRYKLPWLSENTYYGNWNKYGKERVEQYLNDTLNGNDTFEMSIYNLFGLTVNDIHFRSDVISSKKKEIDEIFKIVVRREQEFIILPKSRVVQNQSFGNISTNILTAFHGTFLNFLTLEDILSLELANKTKDSCYDTTLDHDIQMYLQRNWPRFYDDKKIVYSLLKFKISEVLQYFIQKYHHCISKCFDATVLTANEIQSLSQMYNIKMEWNKLIHIDFKTTNESHFCVVYHSDAEGYDYYNYDPKFAIENHTIIFNGDESLDHSDELTKEFTVMVLTSQNNCSPQQTTSMLQWVSGHLRHRQDYHRLELRKFDLNGVSSKILNDLINNKLEGQITFYKMNFELKTLSAVLEQSDNKMIVFKNCQIYVENINDISNVSNTNEIWFEGMDIELNVLNAFKRCKILSFNYCRLVSSNWKIPVNKITGDSIIFKQNKFDTITLLRLFNILLGDTKLHFEFCEIAECDISNMRYFAVPNLVRFKCMSININVVFKILEYCQFQDQIIFGRCHFYFENHSSYAFPLKPVNFLIFQKINFDALTLITILATLHNQSEVQLIDCTISPLGQNVDISNKIIHLRQIEFKKCCIETSTLFTILEISKDTKFFIISCDLMHSTWEEAIDVKFEPKMEMYIEFHDTVIVPRFVRSLFLTNSKIGFINCEINFMEDQFSGIPIKCKKVYFENNTFDLSKHLKSLGDFTSESGIFFEKSHFNLEYSANSNVVIKPLFIEFGSTTFNPENLFKILENISEQTTIIFNECIFAAINWMSSERNFRIKHLHFIETIFEISTILCLLKNFICLEDLKFSNCKIESNDMNCNNVLLTVLVKLEHLVFEDVCYSPSLLQILKSLNETCVVEYFGQLSSHEIIELSTKTNVNGNRLRLFPKFCTKTIYFELFAEFCRPRALNFKFDSETEYDLPVFLLPYIINCESEHDWSTIKLKFVFINDFTIKVEFLRNGRPIDLFLESNDLKDDSGEFILDYS